MKKTWICAMAGTAMLAASLTAAPLSMADAATITCGSGGEGRCTARSASGIRSVYLATKTAKGTVVLVNKSYSDCPRSVNVGWKGAYRPTVKRVVDC